MANLAQMIDESPIFKLLTEVVMEGPGKLVGLIGRAASGIANGLSSFGDKMASVVPGIGNFLSGGGNDGPSQAVAMAPERTPSQSIQTPAQSMDKFTVSMAELGELPPPAVGKAQAMSVGVTV